LPCSGMQGDRGERRLERSQSSSIRRVQGDEKMSTLDLAYGKFSFFLDVIASILEPSEFSFVGTRSSLLRIKQMDIKSPFEGTTLKQKFDMIFKHSRNKKNIRCSRESLLAKDP